MRYRYGYHYCPTKLERVWKPAFVPKNMIFVARHELEAEEYRYILRPKRGVAAENHISSVRNGVFKHALASTDSSLVGEWCPFTIRTFPTEILKYAAISSTILLLARFCFAGSFTEIRNVSSPFLSITSFLAFGVALTFTYIILNTRY